MLYKSKPLRNCRRNCRRGRQILHRKNSWKYFCDKITSLKIEDVNELVQVNKNHQSESKSYWKVVPKDSCEVYKAHRKKREASDKQKVSKNKDESKIQRKKSKEIKRKRVLLKKKIRNARKRTKRYDSSTSSIRSTSLSTTDASKMSLD